MSGLTRTTKKKGNVFQRYFSNFGLKQIADMLILAGAITLIVGLFVYKSFIDGINVVTLVGSVVCAVGFAFRLLIVFKAYRTITNKRDPLYKQAFINLIISAVLLLLAVAIAVISIVLPVVPS